MRREIIDFIFDNLSWFQQFDAVKIYYDGGQGSVSSALHKAIDYALAKNAVIYKPANFIGLLFGSGRGLCLYH